MVVAEFFGEKAKILRREGKFALAETETAYYFLYKEMPVQGFSKKMYSLEDVLQEFEDFVRC